ncbi:MAG: c-type cytochrome [Bacteroidia bacterium]|jgi:cytochrome c oxidase cbb3-type subunit 3|nr:c-type cytochrome [Bacteroidia bacterium]MBP7245021.1 c-type cytochrome [Bacteroidia bacterium]
MKNRFNKILLSGFLLSASTLTSFGQAADAAAPTSAKVPEIFFQSELYLLIFLFLIMLIAIISLTRSLKKLSYAMLSPEKRQALELKKEKAFEEELHGPSLWTRFDRAVLTKAVLVEKEADIMLDHNYDGIRELDNNLPPWWIWGFYLTIVFAFVYLAHYHLFRTGPLQTEEYNIAMQEAADQAKARELKMKDFVSAETITALNTPEALGAGKGIFEKNCVACHGAELGGSVGPNLTDDFWINGGGIKNIFKVITDGVPAKGMISWKSQLTPKQIQQVASFILTKHGSNPVGGKEPQGEKYVEETISAPLTDSISVDSTIIVNQ